MFNQHAKWLKVTRDIPWRRPIASLNYLLTSHVWRQDHNGFSHQDPGFIDHVVNKKADIIRVYLPPDANSLLSVADHCLRSRNYVNVIVAGKQPAPQLAVDGRRRSRTAPRGIGIWDWASNDDGAEPDVVLACAGDVPTLETLAAAALLRKHAARSEGPGGQRGGPDDAAAAERASAWPVGRGFRRPVHHATSRSSSPITAIPGSSTGSPTAGRTTEISTCAGYKEEGTTTTPFDMVDAQRPGSLPPGDGRDRPGARPWRRPPCPAPADGRRAAPAPGLHARARRGSPEVRELDLTDDTPGLTVRVRVLVVNAGSSSLKLSAARDADAPWPTSGAPGRPGRSDHDEARRALRRARTVDAVGHRIVHGGTALLGPTAASTTMSTSCRDARPTWLPCTSPSRWLASTLCRALLPGLPAVACFDTAFHATLPAAADLRHSRRSGATRWACADSASTASRTRTPPAAPRRLLGRPVAELRVVTCHLGAGASLARRAGRPRGRHHDGVHAAGGPGDGDPVGQSSIRGSVLWLQEHAGLLQRRWQPRWSTNPGCWPWAATRTCGL